MDNPLKQEIGFRIWNENNSAILLYMLGKSTTWTIPTVQHEQHENIMGSLLSHLPKADIAAAVCIINTKDSVPLILPGNTEFKNIIYQYIIYDIVINTDGLRKVKLPDNMRSSHFMSFESANVLLYKTPILNHLLNYMEKEKK